MISEARIRFICRNGLGSDRLMFIAWYKAEPKCYQYINSKSERDNVGKVSKGWTLYASQTQANRRTNCRGLYGNQSSLTVVEID
jgi:hypothetical protein